MYVTGGSEVHECRFAFCVSQQRACSATDHLTSALPEKTRASKKKRRRELPCALLRFQIHPREAISTTEDYNHFELMRKGAGASPLFRTDPPKPESQSRLGSGHPGKPILFVAMGRANGVPVVELSSTPNYKHETMGLTGFPVA